MAGFHLGSVGGLILTPVLMKNYGLSGPFWVFGLLGVVWLSLWAPSVYKDPQSNPSISSSEYAHIEQGSEGLGSSSKEAGKGGLPPFRQIFSKMPTWAIIVANAMNNWVSSPRIRFCSWRMSSPLVAFHRAILDPSRLESMQGYFILLSWMPVYFNTVSILLGTRIP